MNDRHVLGRSTALSLQAKAGGLGLFVFLFKLIYLPFGLMIQRQDVGEVGQGVVQRSGQRPRRVDDKHAAAMHAAPLGGWRIHAERGMQPMCRSSFFEFFWQLICL